MPTLTGNQQVKGLMARGIEDIVYWAVKGAEFDEKTPEDWSAFRALLKESRMSKDQFLLYTNAYEAAGMSGIRALSYRKRIPHKILDPASTKISEFLQLRTASSRNEKVGFVVKAESNRITGYEKRIRMTDSKPASMLAIFQVRYTDYDKRWHLYWKRLSGKWWPYIGKRSMHSVNDCLREIKLDQSGCFWG